MPIHPMNDTERAITYLLNAFPSDTFELIYQVVQTQDPSWPAHFDLSLGWQVRNILRQKFDWDDRKLDAEWAELFAMAAQRSVEDYQM